MELVALIAAFCVALSFMLPSSASHHVTLQKPAQYQYGNSAVEQDQISLSLLPRKLKLQDEGEVKSSTDKDIMLHKKLLESSSGSKASRKGTWREWAEEGPHKSEYFTMDYAWVRRRRPIHNKQIPFVP